MRCDILFAQESLSGTGLVEKGDYMKALYLTSLADAGGKSALCAALGRNLKATGKRVGFFKPLAVIPEKAGAIGGDEDSKFMKQVLGLDEPVDLLCPNYLNARDLLETANEKEPAWLNKAEGAFDKVSQGKDVVLIEGLGGFRAGSAEALIVNRTIEALGAKAILIIHYQSELDASQIVTSIKALSGNLLGVIINTVPQRRMEAVKANLMPLLEKSGIKVLGALPEDRALLSVSVGELAQHLGGNFLNSTQGSENLVENIMVGAMSPDPAISYLRLKQNKAVVTRGDRADIQLAALATSTSCLVLTGGLKPLPNVLSRANEVRVPVMMVKEGTVQTMEALEDVLKRAKFCHLRKIERLEQLVGEHLDLKPIYQLA